MPNSSKGCECNAKYCCQCFIRDFPARAKHVELILPDIQGGSYTVDTHWDSVGELVNYLMDCWEEREDTEEIDNDTQQALDSYVGERMKWGRKCPFCSKLGIWNMGDEPHVVDGRLKLTAPIMTIYITAENTV